MMIDREPIFKFVDDVVPGIWNRPGLVDGMDRAIDVALGILPMPQEELSIGPEGIALIKKFEGCAKPRRDGRYEAYPDPGSGGDPWTIGWGHTGPEVVPGVVWTQDKCDRQLEADLVRYADAVRDALDGAATTQGQFDALVSFHYNTGKIARATLTRKHKAGDYAAAANEFARWTFAGGRVMKGLQRRRAAEAALYRGAA